MWLNHWTVPPGCTRLPPRLSSMNYMDQQPHLPWLKQVSQPIARWQQLRHIAAILPHCSSTASAIRRIKISRRRSTTMPSQDPAPSLSPMTRSFSLRTSLNSPTNSTSLAVGVASPSRRKARQQWRQQQLRWHHLRRNHPIRSQGRRMTKVKCLFGKKELL
jgi:hypothetical protein